MILSSFSFLLLVGAAFAAEKMAPYPVPAFKSSDIVQLSIDSSLCPAPGTLGGIDLVWAVDTSASMTLKRYQGGIDFIIEVVSSLKGHIGTADGQTQMGLFLFDETQNVKFVFNSFKTADEIINNLNGLKNSDQNGTDTFFIPAVSYARGMFSKARGGDVQKVLAFVSDGWTNEDELKIAQARIGAEADHITTFFFGFTGDMDKSTVEALVPEELLPERAFTVSSFTDVSLLTQCIVEIGLYCFNGGTPGCHCPPGYTGPHCELAINSCDPEEPIVNAEGHVTGIDICHGHGTCYYDIHTGSSCKCDSPCWTGQWCEILTKNCIDSGRCIAYTTNHTRDNPTTTVQNLCDLPNERCVPDNVDCALNVHVGIDGNGKPYCIPPAPGQKCLCTYPIGWCLPLPPAKTLFKGFASKGTYVDPFFTGN